MRTRIRDLDGQRETPLLPPYFGVPPCADAVRGPVAWQVEIPPGQCKYSKRSPQSIAQKTRLGDTLVIFCRLLDEGAALHFRRWPTAKSSQPPIPTRWQPREFVWLEIRPRCGSIGRASENERFLGVAGGWFRGNKRGANRLSDEAVAPSWSCAAFSFAENSAYPLDKSAEKCRMICIYVVWFLHRGLMAHFTAGEMEVMRILWEHGELKPAEIQGAFSPPDQERRPAVVSDDPGRKRPSDAAGQGQGVLLPPQDETRIDVSLHARRPGQHLLRRVERGLVVPPAGPRKTFAEELLELQRTAQEQPPSADPPRRTTS